MADTAYIHPNNTYIVSSGFSDGQLIRYQYYNTLASALTDAGVGTLIVSYDNIESYTSKDGVQVMFLREQTKDDYVYVIEGLGYQQAGKYYPDLLQATQETSDDTVIAIIGSHTLTEHPRDNVKLLIKAGATLNFSHSVLAERGLYENWYIYCEAGASIVCNNQGWFKNCNIYGRPTLTFSTGSNWDIWVEEGLYSRMDIGVLYSYSPLHADEIYGFLNFDAENVYKMGIDNNFIGLQMQTQPDRIMVRAGYSTASILCETGAFTPAHATIRDTFIKTSSTIGCIQIQENGDVNLKVVNSRLHNTLGSSGACGINQYSGNGGVVNIMLKGTTIETTHASSNSIKVTNADGNTGVITGMNSWANKAVGTDVTQTIAGGLTVDTNVVA